MSSSCDEMLVELSDESLKNIALKLEGYINDEFAEKLGCTTRSVERKLKRIRMIWKTESDET